MEGKLQRMKATLSGLTSKVETKLESSQGDEILCGACLLQSLVCCDVVQKVGRMPVTVP